VLVLERNESIGRKIRISGGGRCNFTNIYTTPENFISANRDFHKSALARYTPEDFIRLVRKHGIAFHEKKHGQLFCDGTSQQIIDLLLGECAVAGVEIRTNVRVTSIEKDTLFTLQTNAGLLETHSLVIATGGLSIPKLGATKFGYDVARQFGLNVTETRPGLVPLTLGGNAGQAFRDLSGVSFDAAVRCGRTAFRENILFTHRGLSGPAILQISSYWAPGRSIRIDTMPGTDDPKSLPRRFLGKWRLLYDGRMDLLHEWELVPSGTEGYDKAEVTVGGVDTNELSSKTMEASKIPGLYFIGEVIDVTGHLGGFNFQWAWASGAAAGQYV
jgi:predicted Rossmann fold flavoprotein